VDREDLRKALTATKLTTKTSIGGPIEFDQYGNNKGAKSGIMQIQGGKPKIVYPPEAATAKAIFPVPPGQKNLILPAFVQRITPIFAGGGNPRHQERLVNHGLCPSYY
jgi:hypothetical protein